ncbi:hypothetical protein ABEG18_02435 [Alsobacter sp. KACC 23698]|uniref:Uncharacterized protein n=1 Tax=Alsobacter sp. KACC 23698 TaxID=3149229 RepID=A0AAU7JGW8_9HYPH
MLLLGPVLALFLVSAWAGLLFGRRYPGILGRRAFQVARLGFAVILIGNFYRPGSNAAITAALVVTTVLTCLTAFVLAAAYKSAGGESAGSRTE